MDKVYLLDSNIYIKAKNILYPFDLFPSFWDKILDFAKQGIIVITQEVYEEILEGEDELSNWLAENKSCFKNKKSSEEIVISCYSDIIQSVYDNAVYKVTAKNEFATVADSWIIAHAKAYGYTLVTEEKRVDLSSKKRVKIPNVCAEHGVKCIDLIDFLRETKVKF